MRTDDPDYAVPIVSDRVTAGGRADEDAGYEAGLRPRTLGEYIGQDRIRDNLQVSVAAAREMTTSGALPSIARAMAASRRETAGPSRHKGVGGPFAMPKA